MDYYFIIPNLYYYSNYAPHYDYDSITFTVPIPENATPGYYDNNNFIELTVDEPYSFQNGTVTFKTNQTFMVDKTGNALVYDLSPSHALFSDYVYYCYMDTGYFGDIYLRFPGNTAAGTYTPGVSPKIVANVGDSEYTLRNHGTSTGNGYYALGFTFREYNINNDVYPYVTRGYKLINNNYFLLPQKDNQYFSASIYNIVVMFLLMWR